LRLFRDIKKLREPTALRSFLIGITYTSRPAKFGAGARDVG